MWATVLTRDTNHRTVSSHEVHTGRYRDTRPETRDRGLVPTTCMRVGSDTVGGCLRVETRAASTHRIERRPSAPTPQNHGAPASRNRSAWPLCFLCTSLHPPWCSSTARTVCTSLCRTLSWITLSDILFVPAPASPYRRSRCASAPWWPSVLALLPWPLRASLPLALPRSPLALPSPVASPQRLSASCLVPSRLAPRSLLAAPLAGTRAAVRCRSCAPIRLSLIHI